MAKKRPMPGAAPTYGDRNLGWFSDYSVEGGSPAPDKVVRARRDLSDMAGSKDRNAQANRMRAANVEGHADMTAKAKREAAIRKLEADAKKPGASRYAKDRAKYARQTGMVKHAKGGSVSKRADGCATKGKTKGRFV